MALYPRLMGLEEPRLPVLHLRAMVAEVRRGKITAVAARNSLGLSGAEATEVQTLLGVVQTGTLTVDELFDVLVLAEALVVPYDTVAAVQTRLGVA